MFLTASFAESLCPIVEFVGLGKHHGHYTDEELDVKLTHVEPKDTLDQMAYNAVKLVRLGFDSVTGWKHDNITINNILNRTIYLETIAAVPGMVAAIVRHFKSLRTMKADGGYLQLFLEEANNERMHLLTFVRMKDPGYLFRGAVILGQVRCIRGVCLWLEAHHTLSSKCSQLVPCSTSFWFSLDLVLALPRHTSLAPNFVIVLLATSKKKRVRRTRRLSRRLKMLKMVLNWQPGRHKRRHRLLLHIGNWAKKELYWI